MSVTVAPAKRAANFPSASCTVSANATPSFQNFASNVSPTQAAKSIPFKPPASVICVAADFVALALNTNPLPLTNPGPLFLTGVVFSGVHVTGPLYPSLNFISLFCGKSLSCNTVPLFANVVPLVVIDSTPPFGFASNKTLTFPLGRSSSFGASGSVLLGSITTTCSLTINICLSTSNEEPSSKVIFSLPGNFPALLESLAGTVISVTVASPISAHTASEFLSAGSTPFFQSIGSSFQTFIVFGFSPPSSCTCSAFDFVYCAL